MYNVTLCCYQWRIQSLIFLGGWLQIRSTKKKNKVINFFWLSYIPSLLKIINLSIKTSQKMSSKQKKVITFCQWENPGPLAYPFKSPTGCYLLTVWSISTVLCILYSFIQKIRNTSFFLHHRYFIVFENYQVLCWTDKLHFELGTQTNVFCNIKKKLDILFN